MKRFVTSGLAFFVLISMAVMLGGCGLAQHSKEAISWAVYDTVTNQINKIRANTTALEDNAMEKAILNDQRTELMPKSSADDTTTTGIPTSSLDLIPQPPDKMTPIPGSYSVGKWSIPERDAAAQVIDNYLMRGPPISSVATN